MAPVVSTELYFRVDFECLYVVVVNFLGFNNRCSTGNSFAVHLEAFMIQVVRDRCI